MFEILNKQILAEGIKRLDIYAPQIAHKIEPGQFVNLCPEDGEERIPLTVIEADRSKGSITVIFKELGTTTGKMGSLPINESVFSILGPLGNPAKIEKRKKIVCIASGIGTAQILPICRLFQKNGNKVIGIIGTKTKTDLSVEPQMRLSCNKILIATQDGSYERRGLATDLLKEVINKQKYHLVYTIGNAAMMEKVCQITKEKRIETRVQLNPMMVDCVGLCGSCRVKVGGKTVLACVEGPEFDGHKVDFKDYQTRLKAFEESDLWPNQTLQHSRKKEEPKILTRFLSDILKK